MHKMQIKPSSVYFVWEAFKRSDTTGKVVLGGCVVEPNQPQYECLDCHFRWNKENAIVAAYSGVSLLKFSVGGFHEGYHEFEVNLDSNTISYWHSLRSQKLISRKFKSAKNERQRLSNTNLLNWKSHYSIDDILDGEQWSLEIVKNGRTLRKNGSNAYPKEFDMLCYWLETLLNISVFDKEYNPDVHLIDLIISVNE